MNETEKRLITLSVEDEYTPNVVKEIVLAELQKGTLEFCGEKWVSNYNKNCVLYQEPYFNHGYTHEILFRGYEEDLNFIANLTDTRARQVMYLEKCLEK